MIDTIDAALVAQNDGGAMAVLNELALAMTAGSGGATLDSALRAVAADRGGEAALGQLLRDALHSGASRGALAVLDLLIDPAAGAPACGCKGKSGGREPVDSGGGGADLAPMSLSTTSTGGNYDDANGNGEYDEGETIYVDGTRPRNPDEEDSGGGTADPWWNPNPGGGTSTDTGGSGPGDGGDGTGKQGNEPDCATTNKTLGVIPPDNAKYYIPEDITDDYLIRAIKHIISIYDNNWANRFNVIGELRAMYTNPNHPLFVDFKDWGTLNGPPGSISGGTITYYSPAAGTTITAPAFEPFGNYFFGLLATFGGLSPEEIRAAAAWYSESGPWWEGDDPQGAPHVSLGIADALAYISGDKSTIFTIGETSCPS